MPTTTKALTTQARDNHGYTYNVSLVETDRVGFDKPDWVLRIHDTHGQWYMTTLEARPIGDTIPLGGQGWDCINFKAILAEAQALLAGLDRVTAAESRAQEQAQWRALTA